MAATPIRNDPSDDTPILKVNVGGKLSGDRVVGGTDLSGVLHYSYTSDVISLTDTATIDVANPDGQLSGTIGKGSRVVLSMADPNVNYGATVPRFSGLVVNPRMTSRGGEKIQLQCADQGWYLEKCDAPLWFNLESSRSLEAFVLRLLRDKPDKKGNTGSDYGWGFFDDAGELKLSKDSSNDVLLRRLNQGAVGVNRSTAVAAIKGKKGVGAADDPFVPPIQVETGVKVGQLLIDYCRRSKLLVNVTSLGYLQLFKPDYAQAVSYRFDYHADDRRSRNNVLDVTVDDSVEGVATDVICVAQNAWFKGVITKKNPNVDKIKRRYRNAGAAPHYMRMTFADNDQLDGDAVANRAVWAFQRGLFDAYTITVEVFGHSQGGIFYVPNTMAAVDDSVHKIKGNFYVSACQYVRDKGGTRTVLSLKIPNLLAA